MSATSPSATGTGAPAVPRQRTRRPSRRPPRPPAPARAAAPVAAAGGPAGTAPGARPALRGWLHAAAAPAVLLAGTALVLRTDTAAGAWTTALFAAASTATFATSAVYHLGRWQEPARAVVQRLDHGNIPLMVASSATPVAVLGLPPRAAAGLLAGMWAAAVLAAAARWAWPGCPRRLHTAVSVALGWALVPALPALAAQAGTAAAVLVGTSGALFTAGGVVFAVRRPDPWPRWFGHHEVFHALTVLAWPLHGAAVGLLGHR